MTDWRLKLRSPAAETRESNLCTRGERTGQERGGGGWGNKDFKNSGLLLTVGATWIGWCLGCCLGNQVTQTPALCGGEKNNKTRWNQLLAGFMSTCKKKKMLSGQQILGAPRSLDIYLLIRFKQLSDTVCRGRVHCHPIEKCKLLSIAGCFCKRGADH